MVFIYIYIYRNFFYFWDRQHLDWGAWDYKIIFSVTSIYKSFEQLYMFSSNLCNIGFFL
jgi:hypothetical protein